MLIELALERSANVDSDKIPDEIVSLLTHSLKPQ
jgi:hypothetical protein